MSWTAKTKRAIPRILEPLLRKIKEAPTGIGPHINKPGESDDDRLGFSDFDKVFDNYDDGTNKSGEAVGVGMFGSEFDPRDFDLYVEAVSDGFVDSLLKPMTKRLLDEKGPTDSELVRRHEKLMEWVKILSQKEMATWFVAGWRDEPAIIDDEFLLESVKSLDALYTRPAANIKGKIRLTGRDVSFWDTYFEMKVQENRMHSMKDVGGRVVTKKGKVAVDLSANSKMDNKSWHDLQCAYDADESRVMPHCGNGQNVLEGEETLLSLRKPVAGNLVSPFVTVVLRNTGWLGESKGRGNSKPDKQYHPHFVELLKAQRAPGVPLVKGVFGGGFGPEINFSFKELEPEQQQEVIDARKKAGLPPLIADWRSAPPDVKRATWDELSKHQKFDKHNYGFSGVLNLGNPSDSDQLPKFITDYTRKAAAGEYMPSEQEWDKALEDFPHWTMMFLGDIVKQHYPQKAVDAIQRIVRHQPSVWVIQNMLHELTPEQTKGVVANAVNHTKDPMVVLQTADTMLSDDDRKEIIRKSIIVNPFQALKTGWKYMQTAQVDTAIANLVSQISEGNVEGEKLVELLQNYLKRFTPPQRTALVDAALNWGSHRFDGGMEVFGLSQIKNALPEPQLKHFVDKLRAEGRLTTMFRYCQDEVTGPERTELIKSAQQDVGMALNFLDWHRTGGDPHTVFRLTSDEVRTLVDATVARDSWQYTHALFLNHIMEMSQTQRKKVVDIAMEMTETGNMRPYKALTPMTYPVLSVQQRESLLKRIQGSEYALHVLLEIGAIMPESQRVKLVKIVLDEGDVDEWNQIPEAFLQNEQGTRLFNLMVERHPLELMMKELLFVSLTKDQKDRVIASLEANTNIPMKALIRDRSNTPTFQQLDDDQRDRLFKAFIKRQHGEAVAMLGAQVPAKYAADIAKLLLDANKWDVVIANTVLWGVLSKDDKRKILVSGAATNPESLMRNYGHFIDAVENPEEIWKTAIYNLVEKARPANYEDIKRLVPPEYQTTFLREAYIAFHSEWVQENKLDWIPEQDRGKFRATMIQVNPFKAAVKFTDLTKDEWDVLMNSAIAADPVMTIEKLAPVHPLDAGQRGTLVAKVLEKSEKKGGVWILENAEKIGLLPDEQDKVVDYLLQNVDLLSDDYIKYLKRGGEDNLKLAFKEIIDQYPRNMMKTYWDKMRGEVIGHGLEGELKGELVNKLASTQADFEWLAEHLKGQANPVLTQEVTSLLDDQGQAQILTQLTQGTAGASAYPPTAAQPPATQDVTDAEEWQEWGRRQESEIDFDRVFAAQRKVDDLYYELFVKGTDVLCVYAADPEAMAKKQQEMAATRRQREALEKIVKDRTGQQEIGPNEKQVLVFAGQKLFNQVIREWFLTSVIQTPELFTNTEFMEDILEFDELYSFPPSKFSQVVIDPLNFEKTYEAFSNARADFRYVPENTHERQTHGVGKHQIVTNIGKPFLEMDIPENTEGWVWVDLGVSQDKEEGAAMQHCGNFHEPDWDVEDHILSLRKPVGTRGKYATPGLTFIINRGWLGQMKGRQNYKPKPTYHPYIVELLKDPRIIGLFGGGHDDTENFHFSELDDAQRAAVRETHKDLITSWQEASTQQKRDALKYFPERNWGSESSGGLHIDPTLVAMIKSDQPLLSDDVKRMIDKGKYGDVLLYLGDKINASQTKTLIKKAIEDDWTWAAEHLADMMTPADKKLMVKRVMQEDDPDDVFGHYDHLLSPTDKAKYIAKTIKTSPFWYLDDDHEDRYQWLSDEQKQEVFQSAFDEDKEQIVTDCWSRVPEDMRESLKNQIREAKGNKWMLQRATHTLAPAEISLMVDGMIQRKQFSFLIDDVPSRVPPELGGKLVAGALKAGHDLSELFEAILADNERERLNVDDATFKALTQQVLDNDGTLDNPPDATWLLRAGESRLLALPELKAAIVDHVLKHESLQAIYQGPDFLGHFNNDQQKTLLEEGLKESPARMLENFSGVLNDTQKKDAVASVAKSNPDWLMDEDNSAWLDQLDDAAKHKMTYDWVKARPVYRLSDKWDYLEPTQRKLLLKQAIQAEGDEGPRLWRQLADKLDEPDRKLLIDSMLEHNRHYPFETSILDSFTEQEKKYYVDQVVDKHSSWVLDRSSVMGRLTDEQKNAVLDKALATTDDPQSLYQNLLYMMRNRNADFFTPEQRMKILKWGLTVDMTGQSSDRLVEFASPRYNSNATDEERQLVFEAFYKMAPAQAIRQFPDFATDAQKQGAMKAEIEKNPLEAIRNFRSQLEADPALMRTTVKNAVKSSPRAMLEMHYDVLDDDDKKVIISGMLDRDDGKALYQFLARADTDVNVAMMRLMTPEQIKKMNQQYLLGLDFGILFKRDNFTELSEDMQDAVINENWSSFPRTLFEYRWNDIRSEETRKKVLEKLASQTIGQWLDPYLRSNPETLSRFTGTARRVVVDWMKEKYGPEALQDRFGEHLTDEEKQALGTEPPAPTSPDAPPESIEDALRRDLQGTLQNRWDEIPPERIPGLVADLDPVWVFQKLVEKMTPEQRVAPIDRLIPRYGPVLLENHAQYLSDEQKERIQNAGGQHQASAECAYCRKPMRLMDNKDVMYCPHCRRELAVEVDRQRFNDDSATRQTLGDEVAQNTPSHYETKFDSNYYQTRVPGDLY